MTLTNSRLQMLKNQVSEWFSGKFSYYKSADSVSRDSVESQNAAELRYPQELLNSVEARASLPNHDIALKKGSLAVLLRYVKPFSGHVSGTRHLVENMTTNILLLEFVSGWKTGLRLI